MFLKVQIRQHFLSKISYNYDDQKNYSCQNYTHTKKNNWWSKIISIEDSNFYNG
jgi:hypothetical protein